MEILTQPLMAAPRLLETFPPTYAGESAAGYSPITFVFDEPMDPARLIVPRDKNTNPDRSYEFTFCCYNTAYDPNQAGQHEFYPIGYWKDGQQPEVVSREGGHILEIANSEMPGFGRETILMRIFRNSFVNLNGEPLLKDYYFPVAAGGTSLDHIYVRVTYPTSASTGVEPTQPISLYFILPPNPDILQVKLRRVQVGLQIKPLSFRWDMPAREIRNRFPPDTEGYLRLILDHYLCRTPLAPTS